MSEAAAAPEIVADAGSPLSPRAMRDLFFAPRRFFSRGSELSDGPEAAVVAWMVGMTLALDRLDSLRIGHIEESWVRTWIFALLAGAIFWSCITSYVGATTAFPKIGRGRAALWFLALPLLFYTIFMIATA